MEQIIQGLVISVWLSLVNPLWKQILERIKTMKEREGKKKCKFLCSSLIRTLASTRAPLTFLIALMLKHAGQEQVRGRHHSHQLSHILSTMWKQETVVLVTLQPGCLSLPSW